MNEVIGKYPFECIQYVTILIDARAHADEWHLFHQPQKRTGARDVKPKEAHSDSFSYLQNEAAGPTQRP